MKRSTERFLTTHTGSLPRPDDLIRMMYAKEEGVPVDRDALAQRVRAAVADVVRKQADAGRPLRISRPAGRMARRKPASKAPATISCPLPTP